MHRLRKTITSAFCMGATSCLTFKASFFAPLHFSGSSYRQNYSDFSKVGYEYIKCYDIILVNIWQENRSINPLTLTLTHSFPYLQLRIDLVGYGHSILFQEDYCVSKRLKHLVCGCLSVSDCQQVTHHFHQATMVSFSHRVA